MEITSFEHLIQVLFILLVLFPIVGYMLYITIRDLLRSL